MSFMDNFKAWLARPFSVDMDAIHWFYLWGLLIVIAVAWGFILRHVFGGIEKVV